MGVSDAVKDPSAGKAGIQSVRLRGPRKWGIRHSHALALFNLGRACFRPWGLWHIINESHVRNSCHPQSFFNSGFESRTGELRAADSCWTVARCPDAHLLLQEASPPHIVSYCLSFLVFSHLVSFGGNAALAPLSPRPLPVITPLPLFLRLQWFMLLSSLLRAFCGSQRPYLCIQDEMEPFRFCLGVVTITWVMDVRIAWVRPSDLWPF